MWSWRDMEIQYGDMEIWRKEKKKGYVDKWQAMTQSHPIEKLDCATRRDQDQAFRRRLALWMIGTAVKARTVVNALFVLRILSILRCTTMSSRDIVESIDFRQGIGDPAGRPIDGWARGSGSGAFGAFPLSHSRRQRSCRALGLGLRSLILFIVQCCMYRCGTPYST